MKSGRLLIVFVVAALAFSALAAPVAAQSERSPILAGAFELFLPTTGFAYAGDWKRGLLPNAVRIGSVVGIVATDACADDDESGGTCIALVAALAISHVWATVGAVKTAQDRNRALEAAPRELVLRPGPTSGSLSFGLAIRR